MKQLPQGGASNAEYHQMTKNEFLTKNKMKTEKNEIPDMAGSLPEEQRTILDLTLGRRAPRNEKERQIAKEIAEGEAKGWMLDMPFD
jgi:hypothetical protein